MTTMTHEDFLTAFEKINNNQDAIDAHRHWEEIDAEWKSLIKKRAPKHEIMAAATGVRTARSYKDLLLDEVARNVCSLSESSGFLIDYNKNTLGRATQIGEVQELSREWHDLRRQGVGGSSLSEAIGFHWKSRPGYPVWMDEDEMDEHWASMAVEKSTPAANPEQITSGVLYRGHVWEPALLCYYSAVTGKTLGVSKATWRGHRDIQVINVDGIIMNDDGVPEGIAECKTSSREWTWENGVPVHYRAQVLWYLDSTGLDYADVIVRFDSGKIDIHRINAGETIDGTSRSKNVVYYLPDITNRWNTLQDMINDPVSLWLDGTEKMSNEILQLSDVYDIEDEWVVDKNRIKKSHLTVKIDVLRPYERMDDSYTIPYHVTTSTGVSSDLVGVSPAFYPTGEDYHPQQGMTMDELDDILGESDWIIAVDSETYQVIADLYGDDMVVHASALRRMVTLYPGMKDFSSVEESVEWLDSLFSGVEGEK